MENTKIIIEVIGGLVSRVISNNENLEYIIVDKDNTQGDESCVGSILSPDLVTDNLYEAYSFGNTLDTEIRLELEQIKKFTNEQTKDEKPTEQNVYDLAYSIVNAGVTKEITSKKWDLANNFLNEYDKLSQMSGDDTNPFNPDVANAEELETAFINNLHSLDENPEKEKYCTIRKDLQEKKSKIEFTDGNRRGFVSGPGKFKYKWVEKIDGDNFYIHIGNRWVEAESIDFDFE
ncbi:MAG: hypothetical protein V4549_07705 [Bacteroidota bacterium]